MVHRRVNLFLPLLSGLSLACVLYMFSYNHAHRVDIANQSQVRGKLLEWSSIPVSRGRQTIRFTLEGYSIDFRIDPYLYQDVMKGRLPGEFVRDANIDVTADASQIASPLRPVLKPSVPIIWVNGLTTNGHMQFGVDAVIEHQAKDQRWGFVLFAAAIAFCCYAVVDWRKRSQKT